MTKGDITTRYHEIEAEMQHPDILSNPTALKALHIEYNELKGKVTVIEDLEKVQADVKQAKETLETTDDPDLATLAREEIEELCKKENRLQATLLELLKPEDPLDKRDIIIEIRAAAGGEEAALFAGDLFRMYARYAEAKGWKVTVMNTSQNDVGGFKEIIFEIKGHKVFSHLKYESGVHRVQRIPETEKSGRIHTSTATVAVLPEAKDVDVDIKPQDLRIDVFRSSGHGGQSVNTTDSAVRITHLPTGIVVSCQDERSQTQNKERAMTILKSRILQLTLENQKKNIDEARRGQIGTGDRSEKIRTYNFPQDRVTDHRIKQSWGQIDRIMNGELDPIIVTLKEQE